MIENRIYFFNEEDTAKESVELSVSKANYPWKVTEINLDSIEVLWEDALLSGLK